MPEATIDLIAQLRGLDAAYYNRISEISDSDYEALSVKAKNRYPDSSYWDTVGAPAPNHLEEVELTIHMGSQQKAHTLDEIVKWKKKLIGLEDPNNQLMMDKLDGSSVELTFFQGELVQAVTRGDGEKGSLITDNAKQWDNLPSINHKGLVIVRGEAILRKSVWEKHYGETKNPRNTGNGIIMTKADTRNRHISFYAFACEFGETEEITLKDHLSLTARLGWLKNMGFATARYYPVRSLKEIDNYGIAWIAERDSLDYDIDGIIVSLNLIKDIESMGYADGGTRPKGQIAWKFEAVSAITTLVGVEITQGHTGAIIPTGKLDPVEIGGVTVSSVLLNNFDFIRNLDLNIGDTVEVVRSGDVIPYICAVVEKGSTGSYKAPECCPSCSKPLEVDGKVTKCINADCAGRSYQLLKNWIKKLKIKHLGDATLEALYDTGLVREIKDFYHLPKGCLSDLQIGDGGRLGVSMAGKIRAEISKTRFIEVDLFMGSLGIKYLGRSMANHIGYSTVDEWMNAPIECLSVKENMGINKAKEMHKEIQKKAPVIEALTNFLTILPPKKRAKETPSSKTVCFTGVRATPEVKEKMEAGGWVEKSGVSGNLDVLVAKDPNSTSGKAKKASGLGVSVMSLEDFIATL